MASNTTTLYNPEMTYVYDKLACWQPMKAVHIVFAYIAVISGIYCFLSRAIPSIRWTHVWSGRVYILSMLWATASSLLIFNTGLPTATIVSFLYVMTGLTVGWVVISFHQRILLDQATLKVQADIIAAGSFPKEASLKQLLDLAKADITTAKTFVQRFVSLKTLHGVVMLLSWINIAGRAFVTNPAEPFYCYSYPVYKPISTPMTPPGASANGDLTPLPASDPNYDDTPWSKTGLLGWSMIMLFVPLGFGFVIAALVAFVEARRSHKTADRKADLMSEPLAAGSVLPSQSPEASQP